MLRQREHVRYGRTVLAGGDVPPPRAPLFPGQRLLFWRLRARHLGQAGLPGRVRPHRRTLYRDHGLLCGILRRVPRTMPPGAFPVERPYGMSNSVRQQPLTHDSPKGRRTVSRASICGAGASQIGCAHEGSYSSGDRKSQTAWGTHVLDDPESVSWKPCPAQCGGGVRCSKTSFETAMLMLLAGGATGFPGTARPPWSRPHYPCRRQGAPGRRVRPSNSR